MSNPTPDGLPLAEIPDMHVAGAASQFAEATELLFRRLPQHNCVLPILVNAG
jgi:hypothetical protein